MLEGFDAGNPPMMRSVHPETSNELALCSLPGSMPRPYCMMHRPPSIGYIDPSQSRTSFSHVLSQNKTWWSPLRFSMEQPRWSTVVVVVDVCKMYDVTIAMHRWLRDLQSAVKMHAEDCCANVGYQMLSTTGMELCNHQKCRFSAQNCWKDGVNSLS